MMLTLSRLKMETSMLSVALVKKGTLAYWTKNLWAVRRKKWRRHSLKT